MILTETQKLEFADAAEPLIEWLNNNVHPHVKVIVDTGSAKLLEASCRIVNEDYIKD